MPRGRRVRRSTPICRRGRLPHSLRRGSTSDARARTRRRPGPCAQRVHRAGASLLRRSLGQLRRGLRGARLRRPEGCRGLWMAGARRKGSRSRACRRAVLERLRGNTALSFALTGITAAVVGVIANLAVFFALHTLLSDTTTASLGPVHLALPILDTAPCPGRSRGDRRGAPVPFCAGRCCARSGCALCSVWAQPCWDCRSSDAGGHPFVVRSRAPRAAKPPAPQHRHRRRARVGAAPRRG